MTFPVLQLGSREERHITEFSLADLLSVYEEFGFVKGSDGQNPDASNKFVSANRGNSRITYGNVYTDSDTGENICFL